MNSKSVLKRKKENMHASSLTCLNLKIGQPELPKSKLLKSLTRAGSKATFQYVYKGYLDEIAKKHSNKKGKKMCILVRMKF